MVAFSSTPDDQQDEDGLQRQAQPEKQRRRGRVRHLNLI